MARITYVKAARESKAKRACYRCGTEIKAGDSYKWFASRRGRYSVRYNFCESCKIRPSDRTTSRLGQLYDAQEDLDLSGGIDEIRAAIEDLGNIARELAEEYQGSIDNMPENLQYSPVAEQMGEYVEALNAYADELDAWDPDEEPEEVDETKLEGDELEEAKEEYERILDAARESAQDIADNFSI